MNSPTYSSSKVSTNSLHTVNGIMQSNWFQEPNFEIAKSTHYHWDNNVSSTCSLKITYPPNTFAPQNLL